MATSTRRHTPQRNSLQQLRHTSRLYAVLSHVGEAVFRESEQPRLFETVCRIAVEHGDFPLAWIGLVDQTSGEVRPAASAGSAASYLGQIRITINLEPEGMGPTGTAIREARPVINNDFVASPTTRSWHAVARSFELRASASFPLLVHGHAIGALNFYANRPGFFDVNEVALLERVAGALAFALEKLADEEQRQLAEQALRLDVERQEALLRLGAMDVASEREVVDFALEEAVRLTHSSVGYLHFITDDQVHLDLFTWTQGVREACYAEERTHYPIAAAGVWVDCVRLRRPVFHNDYQHLPERKGYPAGHIHIERHLSVPLIEGDRVIAVAGVGNKRTPYDDTDARQLQLFMAGMWSLLRRKRAEAALRESEARYRRLTEHATDLIYRIRLQPTSGFEYVNPAATVLTGYTPDEHYADPELGFKLVHPADRGLLARLSQDLAALAEPIELRWIRRDGSLLWVEQRNVPVFDEAGSLIGIEGIARDITDRKLAEQALQDERARLEARVTERTRELQLERDRTRAILESLGDAVMVFDNAHRITYMNPAAVRLTGADADIPERWWKDQRGEADRMLVELRAAAQSRRPWQGELVFRRADGASYDAAVTVAPLFAPDDPAQLIGFVSVHRDITALKTAERMKDQFVSNVSHELRSPTSLITMLAGNLEMLYSRLDDPRRLEVIGEIRKHARHLSDLIGSVLEISHIDSGRVASDRQPLDLAALASTELAHLAPVARRKSLHLGADLPQELPAIGHPGQLQQVLRNLLTNAIKYTPDGGRISVVGRTLVAPARYDEATWPGAGRLPVGTWAAIAVNDTGIGIAPGDLPHIFERFYRVQTQSEIPGTGLGLPIAAELVRRHGGFIEVCSTPGAGSTFAVYLPMAGEVA